MQYHLSRKHIKNIIIRVNKYGEVRVSAPKYARLSDINEFIEAKKTWINERLKTCAMPTSARYFELEFSLKFIQSNKHKIIQKDSILEVYMRDLGDLRALDKLLLNWYKNIWIDDLNISLNKFLPFFKKTPNKISLKNMSSRWGSCNPKRASITLSTALFSKPKICFDCVLLHELTHLIYPNHGAEFYTFIENIMPEYKKIIAMLK